MADTDNAKGKGKRDRAVPVHMDDELYKAAKAKAKKHGLSLGAVVRAFLRLWTDEDSVDQPPPGAQEEMKRPSRRRRRERQ